ncbi:thioredoxin [Chitinophaga skermanii]|uniref:Thioredoxin n=1 Tax=Chitinophaga skermanii TaxID=331697 RepID=A0A327RAG3_9BACT|nr:thioredoxin [Chitinophaga skermanii]RAJ10907.1 thioredoxin [Chitinophaga skermanii]
MALEFTGSNFETEVLNNDKLVVVDMWAEWCSPCRALAPIIEELYKDFRGQVDVGKVNIDHNPQLAIDYDVRSIPAILFFKGGRLVDTVVGARPKAEFEKKIMAHM